MMYHKVSARRDRMWDHTV